MTIEKIKTHGAVLGLEAELSTRITTLRGAVTQRNWTLIHSCAAFIQELAEELRKLDPTPSTPANAPQPISKPS
jgi:hypothetical protein